jgi:Rad52/22 family double-strand break repair protein/Gp157 protein
MDQLTFANASYRTVRDRVKALDPDLDEQTLADTVEGLTDLNEVLGAIVRAALADEALALGLKGGIAEMEGRLERLQERAAKRRQIVKDTMVELDLKKISAPDFTAFIRPGMPALVVLNEEEVPSLYWEPREPRLKRQELASQGRDRSGGCHPLQSRTGFECEDPLMVFSVKQLRALQRKPDHRHIRTRQANGRELTYLEGWYAISEANRIFGFDGWSRETVEARSVLARENKGVFLAIYIARVRITVTAEGATIIREGHGSGEGRGVSPGEVHDIALKAAETDATKRALATFGKPFGLELYRAAKENSGVRRRLPALPHIADQNSNPSGLTLESLPLTEVVNRPVGFHPDDTTPIARPSRFYGRRHDLVTRDRAPGRQGLQVPFAAARQS